MIGAAMHFLQENQINHVLTVGMTKISPFSKASRRAVGPNQPSIECAPANFSRKMRAAVREVNHLPPLGDKIQYAYS
jgi:hypothetical protein